MKVVSECCHEEDDDDDDASEGLTEIDYLDFCFLLNLRDGYSCKYIFTAVMICLRI